MPAPVTIVILNWNGKGFLEKFLPPLMQTAYADYTVLIADNGSSDDSISWVNQNFPSVQTVEFGQNYGFTTGNNKALEYVKTPYYLLLNNDVEVEPGWLAPLMYLMESDPAIAAVQPKLLTYHAKDTFEYAGGAGGYIDRYGYPFCRGRIFDVTEKDTGQYESVHEIFWATGACCLIRKSVTDAIGLFEDDFFAHQEEIDFCWRAKNYGYKIMYTPHSRVWHVGGGTLKRSNPKKTFLNVRNSLAVLIKNLPGGQVVPKVLMRATLDGVWGMKSLFGGDFGTIGAILKGHWHVWLHLGHWRRRRRATYAAKQPEQQTAGYYPRSIVWQHFAKGKKFFGEL